MCFKGVRQFQNSEVMDQQESFCVCIYYGITVVGIDRPGCGGGVHMYWTQQSERLYSGGGGGNHNHENYSRIDRPGCGEGGFHMYWTQKNEGPCLGGERGLQ